MALSQPTALFNTHKQRQRCRFVASAGWDQCRTLLREADQCQDTIRARFERMIVSTQQSVCSAIEAIDGCKFKEDSWRGVEGGGGIARILQDGNVWEKAGVNVSVVYGAMTPEAYRAARPSLNCSAGLVPYFVAGISSVMHPQNPFAPTVHFNYRYFETQATEDSDGAPKPWWFGGGTDLSPAYVFEEDARHFHQVHRRACDKFDTSLYPRFKLAADDYFLIQHRGERRGLGGILFDDLDDRDPEELLKLCTECANCFLDSYLPIVEKRKDAPFNEAHKVWQELRRGRYVEFNLVYDRGTRFGLVGLMKTGALMPLPPVARWNHTHPTEGTQEWKSLQAFKTPQDWLKTSSVDFMVH